MHSNISTTSDFHGDFLIKNTAQDSIPQPIYQYQFYNNALIWDGTFELDLEMYANDGRQILHEKNIGSQDYYLFPNLPIGIYVIRISTNDERQTFKAFSNGEMTTVTDKGAVWHQSSVPIQSDTLLVAKEGYFSRKIPMTGRDSLVTINLLKKEVDELHYFNELINPIAFDLVSSLPSRSNDAQVKSVKIIYDTNDDLMYYMNTKRYPLHFEFAQVQLGFNQGNHIFNQTQYRENPNRYLYPANINYYENLDKYIIHLVTANEMTCQNLKRLYNKIIATSYLEGKLFLLGNRKELLNLSLIHI